MAISTIVVSIIFAMPYQSDYGDVQHPTIKLNQKQSENFWNLISSEVMATPKYKKYYRMSAILREDGKTYIILHSQNIK